MRIAAILAELHVFGGEANFSRPLRLAVSFDDGSLVRLRGSGDGEEMIVDDSRRTHGHGRIRPDRDIDITDRLDRSLAAR